MGQIMKMQGQSASKILAGEGVGLAGTGGGVARKRDAKRQSKVVKGGHHMKESGDVYRSKKASGDVLLPGKHEPYAYIRFNPEMLNPRKKQ